MPDPRIDTTTHNKRSNPQTNGSMNLVYDHRLYSTNIYSPPSTWRLGEADQRTRHEPKGHQTGFHLPFPVCATIHSTTSAADFPSLPSRRNLRRSRTRLPTPRWNRVAIGGAWVVRGPCAATGT